MTYYNLTEYRERLALNSVVCDTRCLKRLSTAAQIQRKRFYFSLLYDTGSITVCGITELAQMMDEIGQINSRSLHICIGLFSFHVRYSSSRRTSSAQLPLTYTVKLIRLPIRWVAYTVNKCLSKQNKKTLLGYDVMQSSAACPASVGQYCAAACCWRCDSCSHCTSTILKLSISRICDVCRRTNELAPFFTTFICVLPHCLPVVSWRRKNSLWFVFRLIVFINSGYKQSCVSFHIRHSWLSTGWKSSRVEIANQISKGTNNVVLKGSW